MDDEIELLLVSLIDMCHVNGQPRVEALEQLMKIINEKPQRVLGMCIPHCSPGAQRHGDRA